VEAARLAQSRRPRHALHATAACHLPSLRQESSHENRVGSGGAAVVSRRIGKLAGPVAAAVAVVITAIALATGGVVRRHIRCCESQTQRSAASPSLPIPIPAPIPIPIPIPIPAALPAARAPPLATVVIVVVTGHISPTRYVARAAFKRQPQTRQSQWRGSRSRRRHLHAPSMGMKRNRFSVMGCGGLGG
jgi:hypothetical protein